MKRAHPRRIILFAPLLLASVAVSGEESCQDNTAKCCNERGGTWSEKTTEAGDTIGFCFEKLPMDTCQVQFLHAEDTELCIEPVIDLGPRGTGDPRLIAVNHLGFPVDAIEITLSKEAARQATPVTLPPGWTAKVEKGNRLVASGPSTPGPFRLHFDLGGATTPKKIDYAVRSGGRVVLARSGYEIPTLPPAETSGSLAGVVLAPSVVEPGETVQLAVRDPVQAPPGGTWSIGGVVIEPQDAVEEEATGAAAPKRPPPGEGYALGEERLLVTLPLGLDVGEAIALRYVDRYGRTLVDVPAAEGIGVAPPSPPSSGPSITGGSRHATAGGRACVCGSFPGPAAWGGLLLQGEALGSHVGASSRVVELPLSADLPPGEHTVTGAPSAGFSADDRWSFDVVSVGAELDQQQLLSGGSTRLHLRVFGTDDPLSVRLTNRTPGVIRLEGGDEQVVETSGGDPNRAERNVEALSRGAFDVNWELVGEPCPCAATAGPAQVQRFAIKEEAPPKRPYSAEGGPAEGRTPAALPRGFEPPAARPERLAMLQGFCAERQGDANARRAAPDEELAGWADFCGKDEDNLRVYGFQCVGSRHGSHAGACATTLLEQWLNDLPSCEFLPEYAILCALLDGQYSQWVTSYSLF